MEGKGIIYWIWPPECRRGVVGIRPSVPPWSSGWSIVARNSGGSDSRAGLSSITMSILDNVPFILPGLTLDGTQFKQFAKVYDFVLRIETAFEEEIVVNLEHGQERCRSGGGALNDRVDELHLIRTESSEFWDCDRG